MTPAATEISAELASELAANDGAEAARLAQKNREALLALPPGIHFDVPHEVYHARVINFVSKSALDRVRRAPRIHWAWARGYEKKETPAPRFGNAVHMRLLEPDRFRRTYVIAPDFGDLRFKENKAKKKDWADEHPNAIVMSAVEGERLIGMANAIAEHHLARPLLEAGKPEVTARWACPATGLPAKVRGDYVREDFHVLADLKTCEDASLDGFRKSVVRYGYYRQDPLYRAIFGEAGLYINKFVFVAVEKEFPYLVNLHELTPEAYHTGHLSWQRDAQTLARCIETNEWPGYEETIHKIDLPPWAD